MADTTITTKIPLWAGGRLTNAAFVRYAASALAPIARTGFDILQIRQLGPQVQDSINRLVTFLNQSAGFDETATISKLDAKRDALYHVLWNGWSAATQIDDDDPFGAAAARLRLTMTAYKGLDRHELSKETQEVEGLQRDLAGEANAAALAKLGFDKIAVELFATNAALAEAVARREAERGERITGRGGETTASLRKATAALLVEAFDKVNAVASLMPSEAVAQCVSDVVGVVAHYKRVAAQPPAKQNKGEDDIAEPTGEGAGDAAEEQG